jgi:hypothetical protein
VIGDRLRISARGVEHSHVGSANDPRALKRPIVLASRRAHNPPSGKQKVNGLGNGSEWDEPLECDPKSLGYVRN